MSDNPSYDQVKKSAESCTKCVLSKTRTKVVFGTGPIPCTLMLIGEGPGEQEDLAGLPFVGKAGQLLTQILASANINRDSDIYITNIVKCRPPGNRVPVKEEIETCFPYLEAQIRLINPSIILLAGSPACKTVLKSDEPITKIRGKWFKLPWDETISVMPIFHPSYLLRNASREKGSPKWLTWQDMLEVENALKFIKKVIELQQ